MKRTSHSHRGVAVSSIFRILIIISGLLMWVPYLAPFWYMNTEDSEIRNLLQSDGYSASLSYDSEIYRVWPAAFVGILFGALLLLASRASGVPAVSHRLD